jgi:hypothetical protein
MFETTSAWLAFDLAAVALLAIGGQLVLGGGAAVVAGPAAYVTLDRVLARLQTGSWFGTPADLVGGGRA